MTTRMMNEQDRPTATVFPAEMPERLGMLPESPSQRDAFSRLLRGLATRVEAFRERWHVLDQLSGMSDRDLADIGLGRSQIHDVFDPDFARAKDAPSRPALFLRWTLGATGSLAAGWTIEGHEGFRTGGRFPTMKGSRSRQTETGLSLVSCLAAHTSAQSGSGVSMPGRLSLPDEQHDLVGVPEPCQASSSNGSRHIVRGGGNKLVYRAIVALAAIGGYLIVSGLLIEACIGVVKLLDQCWMGH